MSNVQELLLKFDRKFGTDNKFDSLKANKHTLTMNSKVTGFCFITHACIACLHTVFQPVLFQFFNRSLLSWEVRGLLVIFMTMLKQYNAVAEAVSCNKAVRLTCNVFSRFSR